MVNVQVGTTQVLNVQKLLSVWVTYTAYPSEKRRRIQMGSQISEHLLSLIGNDSILSHQCNIHMIIDRYDTHHIVLIVKS